MRTLPLAAATLLVLAAQSPARASDGFLVLDNADRQVPFTDVRWTDPLVPEIPEDGASAPIPLPFPFRLYGVEYRSVVVGEDGWIGLLPQSAPSGDRGVATAGPARDFVEGRADGAVASRGTVRGEPAAVVDVLRADWTQRPGSRIQVQSNDRAFVVRWVRVGTSDRRAWATFEALLHPDGSITWQFYEVRDPEGRLRAAGRGVRSRGRGEQDLQDGRYAPRPGFRVSLVRPAGEDDDPVDYLAGDCFSGFGNTAAPWCDTVNPIPQVECTAHAGEPYDPTTGSRGCGGQIGGFPATDCSACDETEALDWHFNEEFDANANGQGDPNECYCKGCQYVFYILVECGTEMHMPLFDMEGARVRVFDALTGDPIFGDAFDPADADGLGLRGQNDCLKNPFNYCNMCTLTVPAFGITVNAGIVPDINGDTGLCQDQGQLGQALHFLGICDDDDGDTVEDAGCQEMIDDPNITGISFVPCRAYDQVTSAGGSEVAFGLPNPPSCNDSAQCPDGTGSNLAHELQNTDVVLDGPNGLCGVFRVEVDSGGCVWDLFANCDGSSTPGFRIFHNCVDALRAWNPLPEYILEKVTQGGGCPADASDPNRPTVDVEVRNIGCCDLTGDADSTVCPTPFPAVPVHVLFVDPQNPTQVVCTGPNPDGSFTMDFDPAQMKQQSGSTQTLSLPYPAACGFNTLPARAIVLLDPDINPGDGGAVLECTEQPGASSCGSVNVPQLDIDVCACQFFLSADFNGPDRLCVDQNGTPADPSDDTATIPGGDPLDASMSLSNPTCPNPEFQFFRLGPGPGEDPADPTTWTMRVSGNLNPNVTDPALSGVTFPCADSDPYAFELEYSCADEALNPAGCLKIARITGVCRIGDPVDVVSIPDINGGPASETICGGDTFTLQALITGNLVPSATWTTDTPGALDNCDCADGTPCDGDVQCDGLPQGLACGSTVTYTAETLNQGGCLVQDTFQLVVQGDNLRPIPCSLRVTKTDTDNSSPGNENLQFDFLPIGFRCPAAPPLEIVSFPCTRQDWTTCPNGNPPGTGPYDLSYMEADGQVGASGDFVPVTMVGGASTAEKLVYFQARAVASCEGPGPLGLPASGPPFSCP